MAHRNRWFTGVYLLKIVIFHGELLNNQRVTKPSKNSKVPVNSFVTRWWLFAGHVPRMVPERCRDHHKTNRHEVILWYSTISWCGRSGSICFNSWRINDSLWIATKMLTMQQWTWVNPTNVSMNVNCCRWDWHLSYYLIMLTDVSPLLMGYPPLSNNNGQ